MLLCLPYLCITLTAKTQFSNYLSPFLSLFFFNYFKFYFNVTIFFFPFQVAILNRVPKFLDLHCYQN